MASVKWKSQGRGGRGGMSGKKNEKREMGEYLENRGKTALKWSMDQTGITQIKIKGKKKTTQKVMK